MQVQTLYNHILNTAKVPSFSSFEERLHPYIRTFFKSISTAEELEVGGNNLIYRIGDDANKPQIALAAHLDKINHYGSNYPEVLPVKATDLYLEGAMDDCAGLGILLYIAEQWDPHHWPNLLFFFSEMEESKGLKEHPELLRNNGEGYYHGMGAERIAERCIALNLIPSVVITIDTTPLFKGESGIALYSNHWELNELKKPSRKLRRDTLTAVNDFLAIEDAIQIDNNTNDYLHYGEVFNKDPDNDVVSLALEPAIYPYHQKGERVYKEDVRTAAAILRQYLLKNASWFSQSLHQ